MIFVKPYSSVILIAFLVIITSFSLLFGSIDFNRNTKEGLEGVVPVPIIINPNTNKIEDGYYQIDDTHMALLPYGFGIDPYDPKKILPITKIGESIVKATYYPSIPKYGENMPEGFYFVTDTSLAVLPPNMKPNINSIDFSGNPLKIYIRYGTGYVSELLYYNKQFRPERYPQSLPKEVYYVDASRTFISFLKNDEIANTSKGYGKIPRPTQGKIMKNVNTDISGNKDVSNNYDMQFHHDVSEIKKQNSMYDLNFGEIKVKDKSGNIVTIPKTNSQESVLFYNPGEFPFGASTYVPNYEDSVYLSSIGYRTRFGNTHFGNTYSGNTQSKSCEGICKEYTDFKTKMDKFFNV